VYRLRDGRIIEPTAWMTNPDPATYNSWNEFCKQLMWDFMLGEAFVLPMAHGSDGYPMRFRVIPPWLVTVEMNGGTREYRLGGAGGADITGEVLHIRYRSTTDYARGYGPLESAGARMTAIGLLQRYANNLAETGGTPLYWLGVERRINPSEGRDLLDTWIESRTKYAGHPALVGSGATLNQASSMNAQDMALLELQQFNESRISVLLGVQPYLIGLPGPGGLTYSNVSDLTDFHDRSSLRPKANAVMTAISQWALPRGQSAELNRDDYTRAELKDRVAAYKTLVEIGALSADEIRVIERFYGVSAPAQLTGGLT
jgi:HK97 family phage portal protein